MPHLLQFLREALSSSIPHTHTCFAGHHHHDNDPHHDHDHLLNLLHRNEDDDDFSQHGPCVSIQPSAGHMATLQVFFLATQREWSC